MLIASANALAEELFFRHHHRHDRQPGPSCRRRCYQRPLQPAAAFRRHPRPGAQPPDLVAPHAALPPAHVLPSGTLHGFETDPSRVLGPVAGIEAIVTDAVFRRGAWPCDVPAGRSHLTGHEDNGWSGCMPRMALHTVAAGGAERMPVRRRPCRLRSQTIVSHDVCAGQESSRTGLETARGRELPRGFESHTLRSHQRKLCLELRVPACIC
jgi:hypothetical protein